MGTRVGRVLANEEVGREGAPRRSEVPGAASARRSERSAQEPGGVSNGEVEVQADILNRRRYAGVTLGCCVTHRDTGYQI